MLDVVAVVLVEVSVEDVLDVDEVSEADVLLLVLLEEPQGAQHSEMRRPPSRALTHPTARPLPFWNRPPKQSACFGHTLGFMKLPGTRAPGVLNVKDDSTILNIYCSSWQDYTRHWCF